LWLAVSALGAPAVLLAQKPQRTPAQHVVVAVPDSMKWNAAPPVLPAGAKLAVLDGDPAKRGPFTMRLSFPDGYTIPPHFHPVAEHVTVIRGTVLVGMGNQLDPTKFNELPEGTFAVIPPRMRHFARAKGDVIIQLHGTGPWQLIYVNRADDPRRKPVS